MPPANPRRYHGPVHEAYEQAVAAEEPVFAPVSIFADDRGWSLMNLLKHVMRPEGQANYSVMYPHVVKAWHRHAQQTDFWVCVQGMLKVGVHREADSQSWQMVTGEKQPGMLVIPPGLWHGAATVGPQSAGLLYYVSHQYDADRPDEQRAAWDAFDFDWGVAFH